MDTPEDIRREKVARWKEEQFWAKSDYCEKCLQHDESCPFYDPLEEYWDFEECFENE